MIFNEIYGSYFKTVANIIGRACNGELDKNSLYDEVIKGGFAESTLNIPSSIKTEWHIITDEYTTPLKSVPNMPLTTLQKRWLKAILNDKRAKLFNIDDEGLEGVEPLFSQDTFVYFDRYEDCDDFENEDYIRNFQLILEALKRHKGLCIEYTVRNGRNKFFNRIPYKLEYSAKDDKFRLIAVNEKTGKRNIFNLSKIVSCKITDSNYNIKDYSYKYEQSAVVIIRDERKALERVMLCFSHLKKSSEQLDDLHYRLTIYYDKSDETEILIRLLSFGTLVKVISPDSLVEQIKYRIGRQKIAD